MPRSLGLTAESPASVEQFHAAFSDEAYWRARLAVNDSGATSLDALDVGDDGRVEVAMTLRPLGDHFPRLITQFQRGDLKIVHTEQWRWTGDGKMSGQVKFVVSGIPLSGLGALMLAPTVSGSLLSGTATVEVRVPLVGGTIERFIGGHLPDGIVMTERFTTEWIAAHG